jgi:hypothetical protein
MKISLLCPTRDRQGGAERLWLSARVTALHPGNVEVVYYVDDTDSASKEAIESLQDAYPGHIKLVEGPRVILSEMWNEAAKVAAGEILGCCADDIEFKTDHWDEMITKEYEKVPDRLLMVYGRDGIQDTRINYPDCVIGPCRMNPRNGQPGGPCWSSWEHGFGPEPLASHPFLHRKWVDILGYFFPPYFEAGYNDTWTTALATKIDRKKYLPEFYMEHLHAGFNKSKWDALYNERAKHILPSRKKFCDLYDLREEHAAKLRKYING